MAQVSTLTSQPATQRADLSPAALIRSSGVLAVISGAYLFILPFIHPNDDHGNEHASWVPVHLLYFFALMLLMLVLVGIFVRQFHQAGRLGFAGFLTAFMGTALVLMEGREHLFSPDFNQGTPRGLYELILESVVFSVGFILLGIAISRARVLPRSAGVVLAVSGPVVAFAPPIGSVIVMTVSQAIFGAGLMWIGYALWKETAQPDMRG